MSYPTYEIWITGLTEEQRHAAEQLTATFRAAGANNPESSAKSKVSENIAQLARYLFLSKVWSNHIATWTIGSRQLDGLAAAPTTLPVPLNTQAAIARIADAGLSKSDIAAVAGAVAFITASGVINLIDEGWDAERGNDMRE